MAIRVVTGPPGTGKTLTLTEMAIEEFNNINKGIKTKNFVYYNNIFSNYPILLKKSKKKFYATDGFIKYESIPIKKEKKENGNYYYKKCSEEEREYYGIFSNKIRYEKDKNVVGSDGVIRYSNDGSNSYFGRVDYS